jgi:hypothetical protein
VPLDKQRLDSSKGAVTGNTRTGSTSTNNNYIKLSFHRDCVTNPQTVGFIATKLQQKQIAKKSKGNFFT